jgi:hypothetical protein
MDHQQMEERFRDRLAKVDKLCGKTTDTRVLILPPAPSPTGHYPP